MLLLWEPLNIATGLHAIGLPVTNGQQGTQKPLQLFTERHHNPSQAVVFMYIGHSAASLPFLSHSLALGGMCRSSERRREAGRDGWRDRGREGSSLLFVSLSPHLFGEFADDTDQCSIFIFKTLVVCSQVDQNLVVKKVHIRTKYKTSLMIYFLFSRNWIMTHRTLRLYILGTQQQLTIMPGDQQRLQSRN